MFLLFLTLFSQIDINSDSVSIKDSTFVNDTIYDLRDFRLPDVGVMSLSLNANLSSDFESSKNENYDYSHIYVYNPVQLDWRVSISGEKRFLSLHLRPGILINHYSYVTEFAPDSLYENTLFRLYTGGYGFFSGGWYIGASPWFLGGGLSVYGNYGFEYRENNYVSGFVPYEDLSLLEILIGGGVGKIRNVGPAARAWLVLEEIDEATYDNIESMAGILARQWEYQLNHWRYEKYFYQDIEEQLLEEGIMDDLTAYQLMRLREIIGNNDYFNRNSGIRLKVMAGIGYNDGYSYYEELSPKLCLSVVGGYPISRRWQLYFSNYNTIYVPVSFYYMLEEYKPELKLQISTGASYYLGDSWKISTDISGYFRAEDDYYSDYSFFYWLQCSPFKLNWYLDNRLDISFQTTYLWERVYWYGSDECGHSLNVSAGLNWRLR